MQRWEYTQFDDSDLISGLTLDTFGLQGWELVSVVVFPGRENWETASFVYYFKRPIGEGS